MPLSLSQIAHALGGSPAAHTAAARVILQTRHGMPSMQQRANARFLDEIRASRTPASEAERKAKREAAMKLSETAFKPKKDSVGKKIALGAAAVGATAAAAGAKAYHDHRLSEAEHQQRVEASQKAAETRKRRVQKVDGLIGALHNVIDWGLVGAAAGAVAGAAIGKKPIGHRIGDAVAGAIGGAVLGGVVGGVRSVRAAKHTGYEIPDPPEKDRSKPLTEKQLRINREWNEKHKLPPGVRPTTLAEIRAKNGQGGLSEAEHAQRVAAAHAPRHRRAEKSDGPGGLLGALRKAYAPLQGDPDTIDAARHARTQKGDAMSDTMEDLLLKALDEVLDLPEDEIDEGLAKLEEAVADHPLAKGFLAGLAARAGKSVGRAVGRGVSRFAEADSLMGRSSAKTIEAAFGNKGRQLGTRAGNAVEAAGAHVAAKAKKVGRGVLTAIDDADKSARTAAMARGGRKAEHDYLKSPTGSGAAADRMHARGDIAAGARIVKDGRAHANYMGQASTRDRRIVNNRIGVIGGIGAGAAAGTALAVGGGGTLSDAQHEQRVHAAEASAAKRRGQHAQKSDEIDTLMKRALDEVAALPEAERAVALVKVTHLASGRDYVAELLAPLKKVDAAVEAPAEMIELDADLEAALAKFEDDLAAMSDDDYQATLVRFEREFGGTDLMKMTPFGAMADTALRAFKHGGSVRSMVSRVAQATGRAYQRVEDAAGRAGASVGRKVAQAHYDKTGRAAVDSAAGYKQGSAVVNAARPKYAQAPRAAVGDDAIRQAHRNHVPGEQRKWDEKAHKVGNQFAGSAVAAARETSAGKGAARGAAIGRHVPGAVGGLATAAGVGAAISAGNNALGAHGLSEKEHAQRVAAAQASADRRRGGGHAVGKGDDDLSLKKGVFTAMADLIKAV